MFSLLKYKSLPNLFSRSFGALHRPTKNLDNPKSIEYHMALEYDWGCHNYHPLPVVISEGNGVFVTDVEGKKYYDFLSAYSAVNQGHGHPKIMEAMISQAKKLQLTSRAFYTDQLGITEKYLANTFGYEKVLMANGGVEAGEGALKIARKWAYMKKKVPNNKAVTLFAKGNFWGRTLAACASSDDPERYENFGPLGGLGFEIIEYDDINALEKKLASNPNICAYMVEPIQGEAGVIYPKPGYLKKVKELCQKYNVLLICDEIQTGLGRTGKLYACEWEGVKPDIMLLGKALSGGFYPISAVLSSREIMDCIKPGEHGSTYGGNPLACAIARTAIQVLFDEGMIENSRKLGVILNDELQTLTKKPFIKEVRGGKGLFAAIEFREDSKVQAWDVTMLLKEKGLLAKPTHGTTIRFAPPLIMTEKQLDECLKIIKGVINGL